MKRRVLTALRVPQDGSARAADARKVLSNIMQKGRGAVADLAWLMLVLPPDRVRKILTSGGQDLTDAERFIMEGYGKVAHLPMPEPRGKPGETIGLRALGAMQGAIAAPPGSGGPTVRVVVLTGYEPEDTLFFLPSGKLAPPTRRMAPLRGHGRKKRPGTAQKQGKDGNPDGP